jgi:hypothetical protein
LQRDERFGERTRWFLSDPSSPARARIHRLRPLLLDNDVYIKVGGWLSLAVRLKTGRNYCAWGQKEDRPRTRSRKVLFVPVKIAINHFSSQTTDIPGYPMCLRSSCQPWIPILDQRKPRSEFSVAVSVAFLPGALGPHGTNTTGSLASGLAGNLGHSYPSAQKTFGFVQGEHKRWGIAETRTLARILYPASTESRK